MDGALAEVETAQRSVLRVDGELASVRSKQVGTAASLVAELDDGMVEGAMYRPDELMVPAVAVQLVAPEEVNC